MERPRGQIQLQGWRRAAFLAGMLLAAWAGLAVGVHALTQNNTLGTDFYIFYHSGQAAFLEHSDPYSLELARQNQLAIFKRPALEGEDQLGFAYPLYALFPLAPFLLLPFEWAQAAWAGLLLVGLLGGLLAAGQHPRPLVLATVIFFYPVTFGLVLGNYAILLAALLLILYGLFQRPSLGPGWQAAGGLALAWLTVKPQLTWLYILFFLLVAARRAWRGVLLWAAGGFAGLAALGFLIRPSWGTEWLDSLQAYAAYNQTWPTVTVLLKDFLPLDAALLLSWGVGAALLAGTGWFFYRWWVGRLSALQALAWGGLVIYLLHPHGKSYEHVAYLVPLVVWAAGLPTLKSWPAGIFWAGSLAVSWAVFFVSIQVGAPASATEWPVLFHLAWVVWLMLTPNSQRPVKYG